MAKNTLAGVQQGGRFLDLRRQSVESLMEIGVEYLAIGSLVPFFNKRRNLKFVGDVLRDARRISGPEMPMHVYGAGDPVELPEHQLAERHLGPHGLHRLDAADGVDLVGGVAAEALLEIVEDRPQAP